MPNKCMGGNCIYMGLALLLIAVALIGWTAYGIVGLFIPVILFIGIEAIIFLSKH